MLPGTNYCRTCGASISGDIAGDSSEQPTAIFNTTGDVTTQRLEPRATSPDRGGRGLPATPHSMTVGSPPVPGLSRKSLGALMIVLIVIVTVAVVAVVKKQGLTGHTEMASQSSSSESTLFYPGAQTVVDVTDKNGGRAIQLRTTDPLERVESWYQTRHQLDKTMRLTPSSVVMKNEKVTVTLVVEDNQTNILVKHWP